MRLTTSATRTMRVSNSALNSPVYSSPPAAFLTIQPITLRTLGHGLKHSRTTGTRSFVQRTMLRERPSFCWLSSATNPLGSRSLPRRQQHRMIWSSLEYRTRERLPADQIKAAMNFIVKSMNVHTILSELRSAPTYRDRGSKIWTANIKKRPRQDRETSPIRRPLSRGFSDEEVSVARKLRLQPPNTQTECHTAHGLCLSSSACGTTIFSESLILKCRPGLAQLPWWPSVQLPSM